MTYGLLLGGLDAAGTGAAAAGAADAACSSFETCDGSPIGSTAPEMTVTPTQGCGVEEGGE